MLRGITEKPIDMNQHAYQIEQDVRVLVARPIHTACTGTDIASLVIELRQRIDQGSADSVVVELNNVEHMDSCCLARLISLHQHARAAGGSVALSQCQPNVEFLFKMTRLDKMLGLFSSTEDAIAELRARRTRTQSPAQASATDTPKNPSKTRGYAPLLAALVRAHKRIHTPQIVAHDQRMHPGSNS